MAIVMVAACSAVGVIALVLIRGADQTDYVSDGWRHSFSRDRRDDD